MKIEKVNDTQIRCTLTKEDLADRQLKLSELAYGTEKAKSLFREMMQQAAYEFGFEADNIPLMIEAIPLPSEAIILIITKVEYPEELDSRFSQFSAPSEEDAPEEQTNAPVPLLEGAEDVMNLLKQMKDKKKDGVPSEKQFSDLKSIAETVNNSLEKLLSSVETSKKENAPVKESVPEDLAKIMIFNNIDEVTQVAALIGNYYKGSNDLYHNTKEENYYLILRRGEHSAEEFNRICNTLSEYSKQGSYSKALEAYFKEHDLCILSKQALQTLNNL